ncbi:MAG: IclR family transcriptional regulator, acetate operon repressor [Streptomyces sp.]|jgi:DNA-binding IclR family transcriptional regulator|nr:IclR family transcriptional regulator, acetate operon repressor [Streptomyces sp.]
MQKGEPNDSVSKSLRTLLLLAAHESMGVAELSRELGVAVSTAHRLLNIMRAHDFVEQDLHSRRYRLGSAALKLGRQTRGDQDLVAAGHPHLARLGAELDETVNLVVLDGAEALFVDGVQGRQSLRVGTRTGARLPAYATAGGKALLAHMPQAIVRTYYPGELWRLTRHTLADLPSLERELEQVRERGYALNLGEHLTEVYAIGVPVDGRHGRPMAALTVAAPSTRWDRTRLAELAPTLSATAAEITRNLARQSP